jgi:hypothetical protein
MMRSKITETPIAADELLSDILDVFTCQQVLRLVKEIRLMKGIGYGRLTLVIQDRQISQLQTQESYDFREDKV